MSAMLRRGSKKAGSTMWQYYAVIGFFVAVVVLSVLYVILFPKLPLSKIPVVDESAIMVHNGNQNNMFKRESNELFQVD